MTSDERADEVGERHGPPPVTETVGAVSISGPTVRMQCERFDEARQDTVLGTANVVAVNLAYCRCVRRCRTISADVTSMAV